MSISETMEARSLAEWRDKIANRADLPFSPPPFSLFMEDESEGGCTVSFGPANSENRLTAEVYRRRFGDTFDLEISSVAVHGPARDAFDRAIEEGKASELIGTGLFRSFMAAAEELARDRFYAALVCRGVANQALWPVLARYGYRQFAGLDFRKIIRTPTHSTSRSHTATFYGHAIERFGI